MMYHIIDMNNQGAALLETGNYKDALTVLNSGLIHLQSYLQNNGQEESEDNMEAAIISDEQGEADAMEEDSPTARLDVSRTFENAYSEKTARRRGGGESYSSFGEEDTCNDADLNQDFVYRHPIFITSESDREIQPILSIILVFNTALSHHLTALDLEHNDTKRGLLLKVAVKLYKLGYNMQIETDVRLSLTYILATVNNWAQIAKELNNEKRSRRLFKHLVTSLMIIIESGARDDIDEMDGFMGAASKAILRDCSFAAAA
jgi:hypothetical protein